MTTNYKILGQTRPTAGTDTSNYVVPETKSALVKSINITNTSATADTYSISLLDSAETVQVPYTVFQKPSSNRVEISTDLITWTNASMPAPVNWTSVTYGPQGWLTAGYDMMNGLSLAKTNDLSVNAWSSLPTGFFSSPLSSDVQGAFYANGKYHVYSMNGIISAPNLAGDNWDTYGPYLMNAGVPGTSSVVYGNGKYVVVPGASGAIWYSTDLQTWNSSTPAFTNQAPSKVSFVNNMFIANPEPNSGASDEFAISTDGITWTISTIGYSSIWKSGVAYNNGKYVMAPYTTGDMVPGPKVAVSTDLITWTVNDLPPSGDVMFNGTYMKNVAFANNHFVISGEMSGKYYKSTDAITWTIGDAVDGIMDGINWENAGKALVSIAPSPQAADYIAYNVNVDGNETITIKSGYTLSENNAIYVKSANGTTTFSTFGAEIS